MKNPFIGTGVALVTPFRKQETIDFSRLEKLIDDIIAGGVDYIVALGTTSEAATMTDTERHALQDFIVESVGGRCPIMLGLGGNNTLAVRDRATDETTTISPSSSRRARLTESQAASSVNPPAASIAEANLLPSSSS